eukprot:m.14725 g.14725  ORF g.14725 m.14725 type:complete len:805 (-) comp8110_c0_seq2:24-2438(-)
MRKKVLLAFPLVVEATAQPLVEQVKAEGFDVQAVGYDAKGPKLEAGELGALLDSTAVCVPLLCKEFDSNKQCKQLLGAVLKAAPRLESIPVLLDAKYKPGSKEAKLLITHGDFLVTVWDGEQLTAADQAQALQQLLSKLRFAGAETAAGPAPLAEGKPLEQQYKEAQQAIVSGAQPCTRAEAIQFAGLQMQVQFGDHNRDQHKKGFVDNLRLFLPPEYAKEKKIEERMLAAHPKWSGTGPQDARYKYVALCRSLKSFGATFFRVQEKLKTKKGLQWCLLGVTDSSMVRLDETTKEVLASWPLASMKRWAAAPATFTFDVGEFVSVQTDEGALISELVASKMNGVLGGKAVDRRSTMATNGSKPPASPNVSREKEKEQSTPRRSTVSAQDSTKISVRKPVQGGTDLLKAVASAIDKAESTAASVTAQTNDAAICLHQYLLLDSASAFASTVLRVLSLCTALPGSGAETLDLPTLAEAVRAAAADLSPLAAHLRVVCAQCSAPQRQTIHTEFKAVVQAVVGVFQSLTPCAHGSLNRGETVEAAEQVATHLCKTLQLAGADMVPPRLQEALRDRLHLVAGAASDLIAVAKAVAGRCPDPALQSNVIAVARAVGTGSTQLVAATNLVLPVLCGGACLPRLAETAKQCQRAVDVLASACRAAAPDDVRGSQEAVAAFAAALGGMVERAGEAARAETAVGRACRQMARASAQLAGVLGDTPELVRVVKEQGQAAGLIVAQLKERAAACEHTKTQQTLSKRCRTLAEAIAHLVEVAKLAAKTPDDDAVLSGLCDASEAVRNECEAAVAALR